MFVNPKHHNRASFDIHDFVPELAEQTPFQRFSKQIGGHVGCRAMLDRHLLRHDPIRHDPILDKEAPNVVVMSVLAA
jgi:hypothetical protein